MPGKISIILPARNESATLGALLAEIRALYADAELIVVNDGSDDDTGEIAEKYCDRVIHHPHSLGNGAAVKSGARAARGEWLVFMDADGQHAPEDITALLERRRQGYEMVIGARTAESHAGAWRRMANALFNTVASIMTGTRILDLTSGFRVVNARLFRKFLYLLPNGFSYPTTITMAFLRSGHPLAWTPITARPRQGKSHVRPLYDGLRFLIIILKVAALYSPMRLFLPVSGGLFLTGLVYYGYTYLVHNRFTNMGAVLFLAALLIFLIGIISEQISSLHYRPVRDEWEERKQGDEH